MYAATTSVALVGGDVRPVEVQVHVGRPFDGHGRGPTDGGGRSCPGRSRTCGGAPVPGGRSQRPAASLWETCRRDRGGGGHHLLMHGPSGGGKSMLATCLAGILPDLTEAEAEEVELALLISARHHAARK